MIKGHGDDIYASSFPVKANFSSNVYGDMLPSELKQHLCQCMDGIGHYPDPEPYALERKLAMTLHLSKEEICVTNGATEAIYLIAQAFGGSHSAILQPTFSEYADACRMHGHRITTLYQLPLIDSPLPLPEAVRLVWLCNPNNPTGRVLEKKKLAELIQSHPEVCFVIDQSYEYFTLQPLFSAAEAAAYSNVLLLHSMTKRYAIPGLRLGYLTGSKGLLQHLRSHRMPWSVNQLAIAAGLYLADHPNDGFPITAYLQETQRLRNQLAALGTVDVWETKTHFMLACLRCGTAQALKAYLLQEHGLLIRDASNFEGLDARYFRVSTQHPEANDHLVAAIAQWFET